MCNEGCQARRRAGRRPTALHLVEAAFCRDHLKMMIGIAEEEVDHRLALEVVGDLVLHGDADAAVELHSDSGTLLDVAAGRLTAAEAIATGRYRVGGALEALGRCGEIFALPVPGAPAPGSG